MDYDEQNYVFSYQTSKSEKVFIYWKGRKVRILSGMDTGQFLDRIDQADPQSAQLLMARVTGNFKRGNERIPSINKWKKE